MRYEGNTLENLIELWDEQELGESKKAKLLEAVDRLLPFDKDGLLLPNYHEAIAVALHAIIFTQQ